MINNKIDIKIVYLGLFAIFLHVCFLKVHKLLQFSKFSFRESKTPPPPPAGSMYGTMCFSLTSVYATILFSLKNFPNLIWDSYIKAGEKLTRDFVLVCIGDLVPLSLLVVCLCCVLGYKFWRNMLCCSK